MQYGVIILAAGKGTRMKSKLPKVLHPLGGRPMLAHLLDLAESLPATPLVIHGHASEQLQSIFGERDIVWVPQQQQLGTGHAVLQTLPQLDDDRLYFILVGDAPLLRRDSLLQLASAASDSGIAVLTVQPADPFGYGRIVRKQRQVVRIVEEKDASPEERRIEEINSGIFAVRGSLLKELLPQISNDNAQKEYYLTDIVALATAQGYAVAPLLISDADEVLGCNNKIQLAQLERIYQHRQAEKLMLAGATLADASRIDVRGQVSVGSDCTIDVNCVFIGRVVLGDNVCIDANCVIENSTIGNNSRIKANSVIENATVGRHVDVGPFARLRPQTCLADHTKVGNFVEIKNSSIAKRAKVNHLSYIGDASIGESVNVGAGTITCNYDGANKSSTIIGKGAFIGSNSALVAPLTIGEDATVAAGSTITADVADGVLVIARTRQVEITNWQRPQKK